MPSVQQAGELIRSRLSRFAPRPFPLKTLAAKAEGLSYAEIRRAVDEAIKEAVMHEGQRVSAQVLGRALEERRRLSERLGQNNKTTSDAARGR